MEIHLTPEQEVRLYRIAVQSGTDAEQLVKDVVLRLSDKDYHFRAAVRKGIEEADRGELIEKEEMDARVERMFK